MQKNRLPGPRALALVGLVLASGACRAPLGGEIARRSQALYGRDAVGDAGADRLAEQLAGPRAGRYAPPPDPTLAGYERAALLDHAGLRAAYQRWRAAVERSGQAGWWPEPQLGYAGFVEEIQTRTGPQRHRISLTQQVPWSGRLSVQQEIAVRHAEAAWHEVQAQELAVRLEVRRAYFGYAYLFRDRDVARRTMELLQGLEGVVQRRIRAGAPQADLLRLQVQIGELQDRLASLEQARPVHNARLAALINRPETGPLPWPQLMEPRLDDPPGIEALRARALAGNPDLRGLEQRVRAAEQGIALARLAGRPDLSVGADYFDTGDALNPGTPGSGDDPFALRVQLALPLWRGKYAAARREAQAQRDAAVSALVARRNALGAELAMARYRVEDAARQVALYRDTLLPRARQTLEVTEAAYVGGGAGFLDVIDSQKTLLAFERSFWRACRDYEVGRAELEALVGGVL